MRLNLLENPHGAHTSTCPDSRSQGEGCAETRLQHDGVSEVPVEQTTGRDTLATVGMGPATENFWGFDVTDSEVLSRQPEYGSRVSSEGHRTPQER